MIVLLLFINLLEFSWIKRKSIVEEYGAFNENNTEQQSLHKKQCLMLLTAVH